MSTHSSITKSMVNYNKNSNFQKICNEKCESLIETYLTNNFNQEEFNILDLGCSQGKNSMIIVNKILDQLVSSSSVISKLNVIHNDLPDNDFEEVLKCAKDSNIGYLNHKIASTTDIEPYIVDKSFYQIVKPYEINLIDIAFSLNTLHWLPSKPCKIYRGLLPNSRNLTESNERIFKDYADDILVNFLNLRYEEMRVGGLLIFNIHRKVNVFDAEDEIWDEHLKHHNFKNETFKDLIMPVYCRSELELKTSIGKVNEKFELIHFSEKTVNGPSLKIGILKAAHRIQIISGLKQYSNQFKGEEELISFVDEFFDKMSNWFNISEPFVSNYWVVLKKKKVISSLL